MDEPEPVTPGTTSAGPGPSGPAGPPPSVDLDLAFSSAYRNLMPRLVAFLRLQGAPLADAADIAQEAMILAYRQWGSITYPSAWTRRVASRLWGRRIAAVDAEPVADLPEHVSLLTVTD